MTDRKQKDRKLLPLSRQNRKTPTQAEQTIWKLLRNRSLKYKFRRQQQIVNYIVDFVCFEKQLIIETDGGQHDILQPEDKVRTEFLNKQGYKVLRFWNNDVLKNIEGVWVVINESLSE